MYCFMVMESFARIHFREFVQINNVNNSGSIENMEVMKIKQ